MFLRSHLPYGSSAQDAIIAHGGRCFRLPRTGLSAFSLLGVLLMSSGRPVYADWIALENNYQEPGRHTVYVDPTTIRRDGYLVTISQLTDYQWMQGNYVGTPRFLSTTAQKQFDCEAKRLRSLAFTEYYGHMATGVKGGGYVDNSTWLPVEPHSTNYALWEVACGKE